MTVAEASQEQVSTPSLMDRALDRARGLLSHRADAPQPDATVFGTAISIAAKFVGCEVPSSVDRLPDETISDALQRIGMKVGLLVREVALPDSDRHEPPGALIAIRKSDGSAVAIQRRRGCLMAAIVEDGISWVRLSKVADQLEPSAHVVSPAFPSKPMQPRDLLLFGVFIARLDIAAFFGMTILTGLVAASIPLASQSVISDFIPGQETALVGQVLVLLALLFGANLATRLAASLAQLRMDGRIGSMLRFAAADRAVRICAETPDAPPPPIAALSARAMATWHQGIWHLVFTLIASVLIALPSLLVVASSVPLAAGIVALTVTVLVGLAGWTAVRQYKALLKGQMVPLSWMSAAFETLSEIETVRSFAAESRMFSRWSESFMSLRERFLSAERVASVTHALSSAAEAILVLFALVAVFVLHSSANSGETVAFIMAVTTIAGTGAALISSLSHVSMLALQKRLITPLLEKVPPSTANGHKLPDFKGGIDVEAVNFSRTAHGRAILQDVSLKVEPGEHIGIAGASGSGKSTILRIMLGLETATSGQVRFDGQDISELDRQDLLRKIGVVSQSGQLFPGSLHENIAAGTHLSPHDAWLALHQAGLADDVKEMPLGLSTPVSDANPTLSGGQIQRLLLARALAAKPKLIVLDEATSALDPAAQRHVKASLDATESSIISIAHRLETLRHCDRIYVLDDGKISEVGSYDELREAGKGFAKMLAAQSGEADDSNSSQPTALDFTNANVDALRSAMDELQKQPPPKMISYF